MRPWPRLRARDSRVPAPRPQAVLQGRSAVAAGGAQSAEDGAAAGEVAREAGLALLHAASRGAEAAAREWGWLAPGPGAGEAGGAAEDGPGEAARVAGEQAVALAAMEAFRPQRLRPMDALSW